MKSKVNIKMKKTKVDWKNLVKISYLCVIFPYLYRYRLRMKKIEVVAAIIRDDEGRIFATQRGYGEWQDFWEFPGGKIEPGESPEEALKREIWEELETRIEVEQLVTTVEYNYPRFHLTMHCFWCHVESGSLTLKEHEAARWLNKENLDSVDWLPADKIVIEKINEL